MSTRLFWIAAAFLSVSTPAHASDGVLEINQTCAQQGCFSGDAPGFPVTIDLSAGRSYRLTSDLLIADVSTTAILVNGSGASVDLNGFSIRGPVTCNFAPYAVCTPVGGAGKGIVAGDGASIRNGMVIGMGLIGIELGFDGQVSDVRVLNNGLFGVMAGPGGSLRNVTASANGATGFELNARARLSDSIASYNGGAGVYAGANCMVQGSLSSNNGLAGIECPEDCLLTGNSIQDNLGAGIVASTPGCPGVVAYGLNQIKDNTGGNVSNSPCSVQLTGNSCGVSATCP